MVTPFPHPCHSLSRRHSHAASARAWAAVGRQVPRPLPPLLCTCISTSFSPSSFLSRTDAYLPPCPRAQPTVDPSTPTPPRLDLPLISDTPQKVTAPLSPIQSRVSRTEVGRGARRIPVTPPCERPPRRHHLDPCPVANRGRSRDQQQKRRGPLENDEIGLGHPCRGLGITAGATAGGSW